MDADLDNMEEKVGKEGIVCRKEVEQCKCGESEARIEKAEARCSKLELDIQKKNIEYEALETKYKTLKLVKLALEDALRVFKQKIDELNERSFCKEGKEKVYCGGGADGKMEEVVDLTGEDDEEDVVIQLMMENSALELEKKRAENELQVWKEKYKELQSFVQRMDFNSILQDREGHLNEKTKLVLEGLDSKADFPMESKRNETDEAMKIRYATEKGKNSLYVRSPFDSPRKEIEYLQTTVASPYNTTPYNYSSFVDQGKRIVPNKERELDCGRNVRKCLAFEEDRSSSKKIAPSTPAGAKPTSVNVIDIYDGDDESDVAPTQVPSTNNHENEKAPMVADDSLEQTVGIEKKMTSAISGQRSKENVNVFKDDVPAPRRKRGYNIIDSDTESDDDDNIPIYKFKRLHLLDIIPDQASSDLKSFSVTSSPRDDTISYKRPRRYLVKLNGSSERCSSSNRNQIDAHRGIPATENLQDDESEEDGSVDEGDSLGGFIVHSSDESSGDDAFSESQDKSGASVDFSEILSTLQRNKGNKSKWEYEADMLADFGKDPELCMKAVCALYRQESEKISQGTYYNGRGFNKYDSQRGCTLGNFLTDGDLNSDLKKSVEELQRNDSEAIKICKKLAARYSKQLFEIYKNKLDPHFHSS